MKKIDLCKARMSGYLADGMSVHKAASLCEYEYAVRIQSRYVRGVYEFTVYFLMRGNIYQTAGRFYLDSLGVARLPEPERKPGFFESLLINFLEHCG